MFYNGANCDIYIGKGAGRKLLNDMRNAKKSIKVVSPFLSPFLIKELINFKKRNLEVELITTDNIEDYFGKYQKNIHKLIIQNREVDKGAAEKREKWKGISKILSYINFGFVAFLIAIAYYLKDEKIVFGAIPIVVIFLIIRFYKTKIKNKRIYFYWYSQLFPFKVYKSPDSTNLSDTFIHGKIYLIDDQIAYLGSLNFTASGTTDPIAVQEIKQELYQLMHHSGLPERNIQYWGKQLYREPIN